MGINLSHEEAVFLHKCCLDIGANIHKARIKKRITIEKLSLLTGLKTKTIERYEMGTRNISFEVLVKLGNVLNVKFEELFKVSN